MRKMTVALIILALIVVGRYWERSNITQICTDMPNEIAEIENAVKKEDFDDAIEKLSGFNKEWKENEKYLDIFIDHSETDQITMKLIRLDRYVKMREVDLSVITMREICAEFEEINKRSRIEISNIL